MTEIPRISAAEWKVMETLWAGAPLSASEVHERLTPESDWQPKTVRTLLGRLLEKGLLCRKKVHGIYVFSPALEREKCVRQESRTFVDRFFGSKPAPMLAYFLEKEELSKREIDDLRRLLDRKSSADSERGRSSDEGR